ncbi:MAG: pitrilysin family protein [Bacteroidota bacterium]
MKKLVLFGICLLVSICGIQAQNMPDNFFFTTLDNGLEVLIIEDRTVPLATIEITVRNGAYCEAPEFDGLSHFYEHMFFKANKDIPSQEAFLARVSELGISFNGTTSGERVNYYVTLSNQKVKEGLEFMNSAIRSPLFLEEEMANEQPVVDEEFLRAESNPTFFLFQDLNHAMWKDNYSRKNVIGDHDIIKSATAEKMRIIQDKYYNPNNSLITVAGDVDHKTMFNMIQSIYGDWEPADFNPFDKYPIPEIEALTEDEFFITEDENAQIPIILIGLHGPDTRNDIKSTYAADIFSYILSQRTSIWQKELVESGLCFQAGEGYSTNRYVGPITISLVPNPGKIPEALAKVDELIAQFANDDFFTDEQLETAKTTLTIQDAFGREQTSQFLHTVTYWWASADIPYYIDYVENLQKVTREDIQDYVKKYYIGQPKVTGMLVSPEMKTDLAVQFMTSQLKK